MNNENNVGSAVMPPATQGENPPTAVVKTDSQRFVDTVMNEFSISTGQGILQLTALQQRIIQGYFLMIDRALKIADESRIKKNESNSNHNYDNNVPFDWKHVNLRDLALDCVHFARMGLDMQEKNHLFAIPFKNGKTGFYDIVFMLGYNGIRYTALKYALEVPKNVTIMLVYSTDTFEPIYKDVDNPITCYRFKMNNPCDRGDIKLGFGYIEYDDPSKNKLIIMTISDIKKRAGKNANAEFWGTALTGKKINVWENGKKVSVDAEGWLAEMCTKTLIREIYNEKNIPRDPSKYDEDYQHYRERSIVYEQVEMEEEAQQVINAEPIDIPPAAIEDKTPVQAPAQPINQPKEAVPINNTPATQNAVNGLTDPDF